MEFAHQSSLIIIAGGIVFFMFGMSIASEALQKLAANRVREILLHLSNNRFLGILVGIVLTLLLQSSGAVTSMLVGLGSARVITLTQVMGVITGTAIGTTLTVQLISFHVSQYGLPIFILGFLCHHMTQKRAVKNAMAVVMGFGMVFFGLHMISQSAQVVSHLPTVEGFLSHMSNHPVVTLAVAAVMTAVFHSSSVTIGLAMGLCSSGVISVYDALFWVYGANIGTTSTALIASAGGNYIGRQVAWAHFFYKMLTCALFIALTGWMEKLLPFIESDLSRQIANAHTLLNVIGAAVMFPFIHWGARWIEKLVQPGPSEREFSPQYLAESTYQSRTLVLAYANRELLRMGDILLSMIKDSIDMFRSEDLDLVESIRKRDDQVDLLTKEISMFLVRHSREAPEGVSPEIFDLISFGGDLEAAADVIDNSLINLSAKMHALKVTFSQHGWREIEGLHQDILRLVSLSLTCFQLKDRSLAQEVIDLKRQLREKERVLKANHISRLNQGLAATINTSSIHLDVLGDLRRIVGLMTNHCYTLLREQSQPVRRVES